MKANFFSRFNQQLQNARQWYEGTPERALEQAFDAALMIKSIEDEHFGGQPIAPENCAYSDNTFAFFQSELKKSLKIAEIRLSEFRTSRSLLNTTDTSATVRPNGRRPDASDQSDAVLEKLTFIDEILDRYKSKPSRSNVSLVPVDDPNASTAIAPRRPDAPEAANANRQKKAEDGEGIMDKTGVLPRSIVGTLNRIKRDLDPNSETQVLQSYRSTKTRTLLSIRFLLLLIIIPLLTQQLSKAVLIGPLVDRIRPVTNERIEIFLNQELQEEALRELQMYRERLEFDLLLGRRPPLEDTENGEPVPEGAETAPPTGADETPATGEGDGTPRGKVAAELSDRVFLRRQLQARAEEIAVSYARRSNNAIKNVFADAFSLMAFALVIATNKREIAVLKSFIDETVYGLSDSAKAFIIILFTDMFVGFHSPHGWEVLLEGLSRHFGLPANREFIFLFIATFPVILDTIFKYWIFRYLNRISPSAVATYRNMNE